VKRFADTLNDAPGEITTSDLENQLDVRLHFMQSLGKLIRQSTEANITAREELRIYKRWLNMIAPYTNSTIRQQIREDMRVCEQHINKKKAEATRNALDDIHGELFRIKPSIYFPAKPETQVGSQGFPWERFLEGKKPFGQRYTTNVLPKRNTDFFFEEWMLRLRTRLPRKDDDYMILCVGDAGSGKSHLMLHGYEYYADQPSIKAIGLNKQGHAESLQYAAKKDKRRFSANDEAQVKARDAMKKYNRDIIDLYLQKRGKQMLDWWNNPQVDILDKPFFDGPVDALIYIYESSSSPRKYAVFTSSQVTSWLEDNHKITLSFLSGKVEDAWFTGWWREYNGELREAYDEAKQQKMDSSIQGFVEKYGDNKTYSMRGASKKAMVDYQTFKKYFDQLEERGEILDEQDFKRTPTGTYKIPEPTMKRVIEHIKEQSQ